MSETTVLAELRAELARVLASGVPSVDVARLLEYLSMLEADLDESDGELARKAALAQIHIEEHKGHVAERVSTREYIHASALELFRSVITSGQGANRAAMAINGGAAIALLAFLGHLVSIRTPPGLIGSVVFPLQSFVVGLLTAAGSAGFTYLAQFCYVEQTKQWNRWGHAATACAFVCWTISIAAFGVGAFAMSHVFSRLP